MRLEQIMLLTIQRLKRGLRRRLRNLFYSCVLKSMGKGCQISEGVLITGADKVSLGQNVSVNDGVIIQSCDGCEIEIGDQVTLSYGAKLITGGLVIGTEGVSHGVHQSKSIVIENSAWIGAGAILLPGIRVGAGAIVAAGSVVSHNVEPHTIVGGVPAKIIRRTVKVEQ
jgi:acetyltransferase-like isoleucine patch superfamily enzyme